MPMHVGGRVLETEMITVGLPATPRERGRGPLSGRPVSRRLIRRVGAPLGHLTMFPQLQNLEAPHTNVVVARRLLKTLWRMSPIIGAKGVFRAYYKSNFTSFKEAEWNKLRDKVLAHLLQHLNEWRSIKENDPLQYMPYMERQFHAATGIQLKGLGDFMGWIKWGSYYHGLVARKGQLHKCPHLAGVKLPRWPQITSSESHQVSQRREETPGTSPHVPSKNPSVAQGAPSDVPALMETGGVGDGRSWVERAKASADDEFRRDRPAKHRQSESRRHGGWCTRNFIIDARLYWGYIFAK